MNIASWEIRSDRDGWSAKHPASGREVWAFEDGQVSDTFHTFDDLYRHRALLTAALFNAWAGFDYEPWEPAMGVHKARLHADGTKLDGYFVVMAQLPTGQISYHYPDADWGLFSVPEQERAAVWDGHTSADVLDRLERYLRGA